MSENQQAVVGAWMIAAGTIASAISASVDVTKTRQDESLNLIGNTLQATGNGLVSQSLSESQFAKIGNLIQATGNSTIIYSILSDFDKEENLNLIIKGNLLQALGGGISFSETYSASSTWGNVYKLNGELLEVVGNSIQSVAAGRELKGMESSSLSASGSWIQAIGAIIVAISVTKENVK